MTWQFDENALIFSAADITGECWVRLKDLMVLHGAWSVLGSGDGLATFENTGDTAGPYDVLSSGATVWNTAAANTFSHTNSWLRLGEMGSTRELLIQRNNSSTSSLEDDITIQVSVTGFDNLTVASAAVAPTASAGDNQFLCGTAVGTEANWGPSYSLDARIHVGVEDTAVNGVFAFCVYSRGSLGTTPNGVFIYDSLQDIVVGDPQPWVTYCPFAGTSGSLDFTALDGTWNYYTDYGGVGEAWLSGRTGVGGSAFGLRDGANLQMFPGAVPPQADGNARVMSIPIGRVSIANYKGVLANYQWKGTAARDYPDTRNITTVNAQVYVDDMLMPRGQNSIPL